MKHTLRPPRPVSRSLPFSAASALGVAIAVASCGGGGGSAPPPGPGNGGGNGTDELELSFLLRRDVSLGSGQVSDSTFRDVDGDGLLDLVQTDVFGTAVRVGLGTQSGDFSPAFVLDVAGAPAALLIDDVNGDTLVDVVVASTTGVAFELAFFAQDAQTGFPSQPTATAELAGATASIAAFPGIGGADLLVAHSPIGEVHRYALTGPGALERTETIDFDAVGGAFPLSVAAIDVANDGTLDLAVGDVNRLLLLRGDGAGGFLAPEVAHQPVASPVSCCAVDVDGDGYDDLVIAQLDAPGGLLALGGAGGLESFVPLPLSGVTSAVVLADLDGDGVRDLAGALFRQMAIEVRLATAPLTFGDSRFYNAGTAPRSLAVVHLPGDTLPDLACSNAEDSSLLRNLGDGTFASLSGYPLGDRPHSVRAADMDGDGHIDTVSVDIFQHAVVVTGGGPGGTFSKADEVTLSSATQELPSTLIVRDFDGDGRPDVLMPVFQTGELRLLRNGGALDLLEPTADDLTIVGTQPLGIDAADIDGDGDLDVLVASSGDDALQVVFGDGTGSFTLGPAVPVPYRPLAVRLLDLDADGDFDAVVTTGENDGSDQHALVLAGDGVSQFALSGQFPLIGLAPAIEVGDFDDNDFADLVFPQQGPVDRIVVLHNHGALTFDAELVTVGLGPGTVEARDANRDGRIDLLVPLASGTLEVLFGDGDGTFTRFTPPDGWSLPVPQGTTSSAWADSDGDGYEDLLLTSPNSPHLWVARNTSIPIED